jgi:tagatose 6-phosphate kinase
MFRVICPNPLLDLIYHSIGNVSDSRLFFEGLEYRAGGFGPNTARALVQLGKEVECHSICGGDVGPLIRKNLIDEGIRIVLHRGDASRVSAIWVSSSNTRMLVSPSPAFSPSGLDRLFDRFEQTTNPEDVVLVGGSVDKVGMPQYVARIKALSRTHKFCFCDVRTSMWRQLLSGGPLVLKLPNLETSGVSVRSRIGWLTEAVNAGASVALCGGGPRRLLARTRQKLYSLTAPPVRVLNPYGAGDCLMATLAASLSLKKTIRKSLQEAVAAAAASVTTLVPGHFELAEARRLLPLVRTETTTISEK